MRRLLAIRSDACAASLSINVAGLTSNCSQDPLYLRGAGRKRDARWVMVNGTLICTENRALGLVVSGQVTSSFVAQQQELISRCTGLTERVSGLREVIGDRPVYTKGGPLPRSAVRRHRARGILLGAPLPALAEWQAAQWLRERLFQTPEPLAAMEAHSAAGLWGVRAWDFRLGSKRLGRARPPVAQLFVTAEVERALPLRQVWPNEDDAQREELCGELGREVGRMHALHFLHADLYPRNVLVDEDSTCGRRLWFLDSWAGGSTAWRRGSLRRVESDLGTWLSAFGPGLDTRLLRTLLEAYLESRSQNGRPIGRVGRWLESVQEARRQELRRLERQRYRLRGAPFPPAGMALPRL